MSTLTILDRYGIEMVGTFTGATAAEVWDAFRREFGNFAILPGSKVTLTHMTSVQFRYTLTDED